MKKLLLVAFVAVCAICATSCKKDPTEKLIGTWNCHEVTNENFEMDGQTFPITMDMNVDITFNDDVAGKMVTAAKILLAGMPLIDETMDAPFTYTFDGNQGVINTEAIEIEMEDGSTLTQEAQTLTFVMVDDTHFTITEVDEETGEPTTLTFTKQ